MTSQFLGGFPGLCEDDQCYDNGRPLSQPPPDLTRHILQHQLTSPTCPTDLIWISLEYPGNTGSPALDANLAKAMEGTFNDHKNRADSLSCNDFEGCLGHCLPVGFEIKQYVHQSSPEYLSIFRVERFLGNFRQNRHIRGTVNYVFENYSLISGEKLRLKDIFVKPNRAVPKFWAKVSQLIAKDSGCSLRNLRLKGRSISTGHLEPGDLILTRGGATIALTAQASSPCRSQALDLSVAEMLEIGAYPALWDDN
ncbi:MAG: hypothetical protein LBE80_01110 [Deltaproteobacteria bacterium]|nr:hypothetical protein [Deltaproteobacteria bacterium]